MVTLEESVAYDWSQTGGFMVNSTVIQGSFGEIVLVLSIIYN